MPSRSEVSRAVRSPSDAHRVIVLMPDQLVEIGPTPTPPAQPIHRPPLIASIRSLADVPTVLSRAGGRPADIRMARHPQVRSGFSAALTIASWLRLPLLARHKRRFRLVLVLDDNGEWLTGPAATGLAWLPALAGIRATTLEIIALCEKASRIARHHALHDRDGAPVADVFTLGGWAPDWFPFSDVRQADAFFFVQPRFHAAPALWTGGWLRLGSLGAPVGGWSASVREANADASLLSNLLGVEEYKAARSPFAFWPAPGRRGSGGLWDISMPPDLTGDNWLITFPEWMVKRSGHDPHLVEGLKFLGRECATFFCALPSSEAIRALETSRFSRNLDAWVAAWRRTQATERGEAARNVREP